MKALRHEAPGPGRAARAAPGAGRSRRAPVAVIFASAYRKHLGKTLLLRALEPLAAGQPLGGRAAGQLTPADPRDSHHLDEVPEGMIVSAVKADHLAAGRLATATDLPETPAWHRPQPAIMHRVLAPTAERDSVKLSGALASLAEGDARADRRPGPGHRRRPRRRPGAAAPAPAAPAAEGRLRHGRRGGAAEPRLPRDHLEAAGDRLPPQEADRRRRPVRRRQADRRPRRARRGLHLRRGRQGRRGAAQLHPRRRDRRPRRHGARPARLPGRRRQRHADRRPGTTRSTARTWPSASPAAAASARR